MSLNYQKTTVKTTVKCDSCCPPTSMAPVFRRALFLRRGVSCPTPVKSVVSRSNSPSVCCDSVGTVRRRDPGSTLPQSPRTRPTPTPSTAGSALMEPGGADVAASVVFVAPIVMTLRSQPQCCTHARSARPNRWCRPSRPTTRPMSPRLSPGPRRTMLSRLSAGSATCCSASASLSLPTAVLPP